MLFSIFITPIIIVDVFQTIKMRVGSTHQVCAALAPNINNNHGDHLTSSKPSFFSFSESGRHRTTTFTHSLRAVRGRADFSIFEPPLFFRLFSLSKVKLAISIHPDNPCRHHLFESHR